MLAYRLIVKGRVQRVGFRGYVLEHARALGLKGNVRSEMMTLCIYMKGMRMY
ncbi:MAG: acylphosphatase [Candidatus Nitrosocaldus sp.]